MYPSITAYQLNPFPNPRKPVGFTAVYVCINFGRHTASRQVKSTQWYSVPRGYWLF